MLEITKVTYSSEICIQRAKEIFIQVLLLFGVYIMKIWVCVKFRRPCYITTHVVKNVFKIMGFRKLVYCWYSSTYSVVLHFSVSRKCTKIRHLIISHSIHVINKWDTNWKIHDSRDVSRLEMLNKSSSCNIGIISNSVFYSELVVRVIRHFFSTFETKILPFVFLSFSRNRCILKRLSENNSTFCSRIKMSHLMNDRADTRKFYFVDVLSRRHI